MTDENTSEFDPTEQEREKQALNDIRRSNLQRVFGQGAGRIAIFTVGGAFILLLGIGLYTLSHHSDAAQRELPMNAAPNSGGGLGDQMVASEREAALRRQANAQGASDAAANHTPFMASPVLVASGTQDTGGAEWGGLSAGAPVQGSRPAAQSTDPTPNPNTANLSAQPASSAAAAPPQVVDVHKLANDLSGTNGDVSSQIAAVLGGGPTASDGSQQASRRRTYSTGYYPTPVVEQPQAPTPLAVGLSTPAAPGSVATSVAGNNQSEAKQTAKDVLPGWTLGTAFYCKIQYGANSDLVRRDVFADCYNGVANGAKFYGKAEPSNEGVADPGFTVTFSSVHIPNQGTFPVQAIAYTNDTMEASVADDVSTHAALKFTELGIAGLLKGIGQAAQLVTGSTTTQTVGNVSTTALNVQAPSLPQIAESAAGGVGNSIGDYVQQRSNALKTTIKIFPGKDIGVVLTADVVNQKQ